MTWQCVNYGRIFIFYIYIFAFGRHIYRKNPKIVYKSPIFSFPGTHDLELCSTGTRTNPFTTTSLTTNKLNECMMITISHQGEKQAGGKRERQRENHLLTLFLLLLPFHQDKFKWWDKDISFSISLFFHFSLSPDSSPPLTSSRHNNTERKTDRKTWGERAGLI